MNSVKHIIPTLTIIFFITVLSACASKPSGKTADVVSPVTEHKRANERRCTCNKMDQQLNLVTQEIQNKKILYSQSAVKADCSGIFHRVLDGLSQQCSCFSRPDYQHHRSTRQLANWYHQQGKLHRIDDALTAQHLIRVGMIMFYGQSNKVYKKVPLADFFKSGKGITHMGIVVDVKRNSKGEVEFYSLFHGRSTGKLAKTTKYHNRKMKYGNGKQRWIAYAKAY